MPLDLLWLDLRRAIRRMVRAPGFALTAILSLAAGMASVVALTGVVDVILYRAPSGVRQAERVVAIGPWAGFQRTTFPDYADLRDHARSLESVAAFAIWNYTARIGASVAPARGMLASHTLLRTLGIPPVAGRSYSANEDRPGAPGVVVISAALARRHFDGPASALGQSVRLAGTDFAIVGVLPEGFTAPDLSPVDLVLPIESAPWFGGREALVNRDYQWVRILGRLRPGITAEQAAAEATGIYRRANVGVRAVDQEALPRATVAVRSLADARRDPQAASTRIAVWLAALGGLVLLIACANVASLLVARGVRDRHELAVHVALGASRGRLAARALLEVLVLVVPGLVAALALARVASAKVTSLLLAGTVAPPPLDARTGAIAAAVAALTCLVCALGPVMRAVRADPGADLAGDTRTATSSHRGPLGVLLALQLALGVVLVSEAALFAVSLRNALRVDLGIALEHLAVADVDLRAAGLSGAAALSAAERAIDVVRRVPGVAATGMTNAATIPGYLNYTIAVPGRDSVPPGLAAGEPFVNSVTPGFLDALGVPRRLGRPLSDADVAGGRPVMLVSERLARIYWPGQNPIGQCARLGRQPSAPCAEVVGVVADRRASPADAHGVAELYLPLGSSAFPDRLAQTFPVRELAVRFDASPERQLPAVQQALLDVIPGLTSVRVRTGSEYVEAQVRSWRLGTVVIGAFGVVALALAAVGVFGVWSHAVARRTRELGIRGALGARPADLAALIGREACAVGLAGVVVGLAGAAAASRLVRAFAFGVSPLDPRVLGAAAGLLMLVTVLAALFPALRAASTDPLVALRDS